jgi:hypothetical protein
MHSWALKIALQVFWYNREPSQGCISLKRLKDVQQQKFMMNSDSTTHPSFDPVRPAPNLGV